jgi:hypothetical protein
MRGAPAQPCGTRRLWPAWQRHYQGRAPDYVHREFLVAGQLTAIPALVDCVRQGLR